MCLFQGTDLEEWECQEKEAELRSLLHQKEEKLKQLRSGERVSVEEIKMPEEGDPDREVSFTRKSSLRMFEVVFVLNGGFVVLHR